MTPRTTGQPGNEVPVAPLSVTLSAPRVRRPGPRVAGIALGAMIVTTRGAHRIEDLRAGDRVITRGNGVVAIGRIERQSLVARAVYVMAGSIGHYRADRDTLLPAGQPILLRDWRARAFSGQREVIACADMLVDGEYVRDIGLCPMTVFRIYCDRPLVLYADGMELCTADAAQALAQDT